MLWWQIIQTKIGGVETRKKAIEQIGASGEANAVETIGKIALDDGSTEVQAVAAQVLGKMGDPAAMNTLIMMLKYGKPDVQQAAAEAMKQIGDTSCIEPLVQVLNEMNPELRAIGVDGLVHFAEKSLPLLVKNLHNVNRSARKSSIEALAKIGLPAAEAVPALFLDKEHTVWETAIDALIAIGPQGVPALLKSLAHENENVRKHVAMALGKIKDPAAVEVLVLALQDTSAAVRELANKALKNQDWQPASDEQQALRHVAERDFEKAAALGDKAIHALVPALTEKDPGTRERVATALASIGSAAVAPLIDALQHPDPMMRACAARALGEIRDDRALEALLPMLNDSDITMRENIVAAFWKAGTPKAMVGLVEALKDEDRLIKARAARALGEIGNESIVEPLLAVVEQDPSVRMEVGLALARFAPGRALPLLIDVVAEDPTAEEAGKTLLVLLQKPPEDVAAEDLKGVLDMKNRQGAAAGARLGLVSSFDYDAAGRLAKAELARRGVKV